MTSKTQNIEYQELLTSWLSMLNTDYDQLIFCLYALGYTQEEIGLTVGQTKQSIQRKIRSYKEVYKEKIQCNIH